MIKIGTTFKDITLIKKLRPSTLLQRVVSLIGFKVKEELPASLFKFSDVSGEWRLHLYYLIVTSQHSSVYIYI